MVAGLQIYSKLTKAFSKSVDFLSRFFFTPSYGDLGYVYAVIKTTERPRQARPY